MLITRTIDEKDLDTVTEWWYQVWGDQYREGGFDTLLKAQLDTRHRVRNGTMHVFVAREGSQVLSVATLVMFRDPTIPRAHTWLSNVFTHPAYRCNGIGARVVRECIRCASGIAGCDSVYLKCGTNHRVWYKHFGFYDYVPAVNGRCLMKIDTNMVAEGFLPHA